LGVILSDPLRRRDSEARNRFPLFGITPYLY